MLTFEAELLRKFIPQVDSQKVSSRDRRGIEIGRRGD